MNPLLLLATAAMPMPMGELTMPFSCFPIGSLVGVYRTDGFQHAGRGMVDGGEDTIDLWISNGGGFRLTMTIPALRTVCEIVSKGAWE